MQFHEAWQIVKKEIDVLDNATKNLINFTTENTNQTQTSENIKITEEYINITEFLNKFKICSDSHIHRLMKDQNISNFKKNDRVYINKYELIIAIKKQLKKRETAHIVTLFDYMMEKSNEFKEMVKKAKELYAEGKLSFAGSFPCS